MPTRYEFGFGYGEIYRRRMRGQERMYRQAQRELEQLSPESRARLRYESDYYGFRGAGSRGGYAAEYRSQSRATERIRDGGRRRGRPGSRRRR